MPLKPILLVTGLALLFSCTAKRVDLPDYEGVDIKDVIAARSNIKRVEATFSVEFEKGDSTMTGDAALELSADTLDLRIYSMGFLMAEIKESRGVIKSKPDPGRSKSIILVDGLRNSIFWWLIADYAMENQNETYQLRNPRQRIVVDKKTMLPAVQTMELDDGRELRIFYEEPVKSGEFWYPSRMRIELSKYLVRIKIKTIYFLPRPAQDQQPLPL